MTAFTKNRSGQAQTLDEEFAASFFNGALNLIVLPTEQCNFRCTYCYEDFAIGRMKREVVEGIKQLIDKRVDDLRYLKISWFGGEPLLAIDIIEEISVHIIQAAAGRPELSYQSDMTTNGSLLDIQLAKRLFELGIRSFQVSLDGPQAQHDTTRLRVSGRGSFDQIWKNLIAIREEDINIDVLLRVHLTPENISVMPDFLVQIRETFLSDPRFSVLLKPVDRMGGSNNDSISTISQDERVRILADLEAILSEGRDNAPLFASESICYAARANSLVIRADGRIGKCTVALSDAANDIGRLMPDGALQINNAILRLWLEGWKSRDRSFLACPYSVMPKNQPIPSQIISARA